MKSDRVRGNRFRFAGRILLAGRIFGIATLLVAFSASLAHAYPQGPELPDDGLYAVDLPLPSFPNAAEWAEAYPGEHSSQLPSMSAADPASDPFDNSVDLATGGMASDSNWQVADDGTNTYEIYKGDPLATGAGSVHVGIDLGDVTNPSFSSLLPSSQYYADSSGNPLEQFPALGFQPSPPTASGGSLHYVTVYMTATGPGGQPAGQWIELPYHAPVPQLTVTAGDQGVSLSNVGYFLSPTQIPLDDLNTNNYPAPGSPGSPFSSLPEYQGSMINGGGSLTITLPEPGSLVLCLAGGIMIAATGVYRRCRKAS